MLWGRQAWIRVILPTGEAREVRGLRVTFRIEASTESSPNTAKIEVYNVNDTTVAWCSEEGATVELYAGYDVPGLLFRGDPIPEEGVRVEYRPPDRVLKLQIQDGGEVYQTGRVSISYASATTYEALLKEAFRQAGIPTATVRYPSGSTPGAYSFAGAVRDLLTDLGKRTGCQWFLKDGAVCFYGDGEAAADSALLVSASKGNLVGMPSIKKEGAVEVKALLSPILRAGSRFQVESRTISGVYVAESVAYSGDNTQGEFVMVITGMPA